MAGLVTSKEKFDAAVRVIQSLPKNGSFQPSYAMMLSFYGLYKQATNGQCNISKPSFWDVVGKAKWEAWHTLGTMSKEQAMTCYVEELKKIIETMPHTENVEGFIDKLGDFYELIEDNTSMPKSSISKLIQNVSPKRQIAKDAESDSSSASLSSPPKMSMANSVADENELTGSSDNEEFCDTSDVANIMAVDNSGTKLEKANITHEHNSITTVPFKLNNQTSVSSFNDQLTITKDFDGGSYEEHLHSVADIDEKHNVIGKMHEMDHDKMTEEITISLLRLQHDMNNVLTRLQTLETLANQKTNAIPEWKLLGNINIPTVILCLTLPFIMQFIIRLINKKRARLPD